MFCGKKGLGLAALWVLGGKVQENVDKPTPNPKQLTRCPECRWEVAKDYSWCPQCGLRLVPYECVYCRNTIPRTHTECPHCGAPIPHQS